MLEAVRATVGPQARIRIDANEAWSVPEAVRLLNRWHERFDIDFAEAPVPIFPLDRMRDLRARTAVALCANEGLGSQADAYQVIASGVADIVCFSSYWVGTLRRFHTLASLAGLAGHRGLQAHPRRAGHRRRRGAPDLLTLPNAVPGRAADRRDHGRRRAGDTLADRQRTALGDSRRRRSRHRDRRGEARAFAEDYRRHGQFLPYAA